jgi:regulator of sigma E protease
MLTGFILLALGAVAVAIGVAAARYAALRAMGIRDLRLALALETRWLHAEAPRHAFFALVAASVAGAYLVASAFAFAGFLGGGNWVVDQTSMRLDVAVDGPAERAGVKNGDRVVSIDGAGVQTWDVLRAAVKAHAGREAAFVVERDGHERAIPIVVPLDGRVRVSPHAETHPVGAGEAAWRALVLPIEINVETVRGFARMFTGREKSELTGPVGIVRETSKAASNGISDALKLVAALISYGLWIVVVVVVIMTPRPSALVRQG